MIDSKTNAAPIANTTNEEAPRRLVVEVPTELKAGLKKVEPVCTCGPTTCCTFGGGCPGPV
jgi:hypothetical protein